MNNYKKEFLVNMKIRQKLFCNFVDSTIRRTKRNVNASSVKQFDQYQISSHLKISKLLLLPGTNNYKRRFRKKTGFSHINKHNEKSFR